jgi:hypothetical protein
MSWEDFYQLFGWNSRRQMFLSGISDVLQHLQTIGCRRVYLDGSFVTQKEIPGDYDACWEPAGVNILGMDPILRNVSPSGRQLQKAKYGGEWFSATQHATMDGLSYLDFFQFDRDMNLKGIVALNLEEPK